MSDQLVDPVDSPYLVPFDGSFHIADAPTAPPVRGSKKAERKALKKAHKQALAESIDGLRTLQRMLYAHDQYSVLLVFQAMDAAGKDGTIRAVMNGINPAGCQVSSFKQPSSLERDHDFLWRVSKQLPERGRIGIFNRSHYEDVLVVRVHPEYLEGMQLPQLNLETIWQQRYESIADLEKHLARNGTVIIKFWLNVSRDEQRDRFLDRIDEPAANWKFSAGDVRERGHWDAYMDAYQAALNATSKPHAPWYAIPADDKPYMRRVVAEIIRDTMERLDISFPEVSEKGLAEMLELRGVLAEQEG